MTAYNPNPKLWDRIAPLPNQCAAVTSCKLNNSPPLLLQHAVNSHNQAQPFNPTGTTIAITNFTTLSFSFEPTVWSANFSSDSSRSVSSELSSISHSESFCFDFDEIFFFHWVKNDWRRWVLREWEGETFNFCPKDWRWVILRPLSRWPKPDSSLLWAKTRQTRFSLLVWARDLDEGSGDRSCEGDCRTLKLLA